MISLMPGSSQTSTVFRIKGLRDRSRAKSPDQYFEVILQSGPELAELAVRNLL